MRRSRLVFGLAVIWALLLAPALQAADVRFTVSELQGRAFLIRPHGVYAPLQAGSALEPDRNVKVGPKSRMDVQSSDGNSLQLGPGAEFVAATGRLQIDEGYLAMNTQPGSDGFEIEMGGWTARLAPGEYAFEIHEGDTTACTISGSMRVTKAATSVASPDPHTCVLLSPDGAAPVALGAPDWASVEKSRKLLPVVTRLSRGAPIETPPRVETASASRTDAPQRLMKMPRTSLIFTKASPVPLEALEGMMQHLDRWIAQAQAARADALVASAEAHPPAAGPARTDIAMASPAASEPPAAVEAPLPPEGPNSEWIVNVATYASQETAEQDAAQLRAQNLAARIRPETIRGRASYRVVIEGLASEQAANAALQSVVSNQGMRKAWVFRKR